MSLQQILEEQIPEPELRTEIERLIDEHLAGGGSIPKARFDEVISQRNALREQLQGTGGELSALRERLDGLPDLDRLREENATLTQQVRESLEREWGQYQPLFGLELEHPLHGKVERIRGDFRFPEDGGDWSTETLSHNLAAIRPYLKADYFRLPESRQVDASKPVTPDFMPVPGLNGLFQAFGG